MSDRLAEIKRMLTDDCQRSEVDRFEVIDWLIAEVELARRLWSRDNLVGQTLWLRLF